MRNREILLIAGFCILFFSNSSAQTPRLYHYEGKLTNEEGLPFEGLVNLTFEIYESPRAEKPVWQEQHTSVKVENGSFNALLGTSSPLKLSYYEYFLKVLPSEGKSDQPLRMIVGSGYNYRLWFLFAAYTIVWLAIFAYFLSLSRRQKKISAELQMLTQEV